MLNILSLKGKLTEILIFSTLVTSIIPSLFHPQVANANTLSVDQNNPNFSLHSNNFELSNFENFYFSKSDEFEGTDYYFSESDEFESADYDQLDEFESLDFLSIIDGIGNFLPKLFGLGRQEPAPQENQNPAPDPFNLLTSLGHQLINCVPGVVFVTGLHPQAICVAPNFNLPPGQYVYNPFMNKIHPAIVNNHNTNNPYNTYSRSGYNQQVHSQANYNNQQIHPQVNAQINHQASYNNQQVHPQVNAQINHQSNTNFWNDGIFDDSSENDDFFNF